MQRMISVSEPNLARPLSYLWTLIYAYGLYITAVFQKKPPGFEAILEFIRADRPSNVELNLSGHQLSDWNIIVLCAVLKRNHHIKTLNLSNNRIGPISLQTLASLTTITDLDLSSNMGLKHNFNYKNKEEAPWWVFANNVSLTRLDVSNTGLTDIGAQALASHTTLKTLNAQGNQITKAGTMALSHSRSITSINLSYNSMELYPKFNSEKPDETLFSKNLVLTTFICHGGNNSIFVGNLVDLINNNILTHISLSTDYINESQAKSLVPYLKKNTALTTFFLDSDKISYATRALLQDTITNKENDTLIGTIIPKKKHSLTQLLSKLTIFTIKPRLRQEGDDNASRIEPNNSTM